MHIAVPAWVFWVHVPIVLACLGATWWVLRARDKAQFVHMVRMLRLNSDAVCLIDARHRITWTNEAYLTLTGFARDELAGMPLGALLNGSVQGDDAVACIQAAVRAEQELRIDLQFRRQSGDVRCMVMELHPVHDVRGRRLLGYVIVQIDIDRQRREREATLDALRDRQAVLDILDQHAIVTETDLQGAITRVNARFVEISGYEPAELLGRNHRMVSSGHHPAPFWAQMWDTLCQGRIWHGEICNRAKDGSLYWVDSVIAPMLGADGLPARYVSIRTDITALKRSRDMLARTGHIAGIGGWYCDLETQTLYFTEVARDILELPRTSIGVKDALEELLPDPMRTEFPASVQQAMATGESFSKDIWMFKPGGGGIWVRVSCEMEYMHGHPYRLVGAVQDVSSQVEARQRAEASERILRSAIDAMDEAFALYDAQERLVLCNDKYLDLLGSQRGQVSTGMSAEAMLRLAAQAGTYCTARDEPDGWVTEQLRLWRQPSYRQRLRLVDGRWIKSMGTTTPDGMHVMFRVDITDLQSALEAADTASRSKSQFLANMSHEIRTPMNAVMGLLQVLEHTRLDAEQRALLRKVEGSARSLLDILNDILDFSKIEAGKMRLEAAPFVFAELLEDLSTILGGNLGAKPLELIYDIDPGIPPVLVGDVLRLKQILINLGGNAIKFTAQGEVQVQVRRLREDAQGVLLEFAVEDTGIGIGPEAIGHIFQGFSQAESSTSRRYGGTGLGLSISRRLVQLMGGDLAVASEPGRGSRFSFEALLLPGAAAPPLAPPASQGQALLVEPHPASRRALARMLGQGGEWTVHAFADAAQARRALDDGLAPALALLSTALPGCMPLAEHLRGRGAATLLTASHQRPIPAALPVLRKPLTCSMVQTALRLRAQEPATPAAQGQRLKGLRLLLVEDNELNQEVALRLLGREGATVRVAGNGQLGLDALAADPQGYDLVLMDMQMPVLDGLEAARAIRAQPCHAALPIVAMTANAMQSDRQACLDAGMNDHVGKPFDLETLVTAVLRHTGGGPVAGRPAGAPAAEPDALFDARAALDRLGGDEAFFARLLQDFAAVSRALAQRIAAALAAGDLGQAHDAAHQLKGTAASTGAQRLAELCARIEQAARAGGPPAAPLGAVLEETLGVQAEWLRARARPGGAGASLDSDLAALAAALQASDMAALDCFDDLLERHGDALDAQALAPLREAMDVFDTEAALAALRRLQA